MDTIAPLLLQGMTAWERGDEVAAIRHLRAALALRGDLPQWWAALASIERHAELYAASVASYRRALALLLEGGSAPCPVCGGGCEPPVSMVHHGLSLVLWECGEADAARAEAETALRLEPCAAHALTVARFLESAGRRGDARACLVQALRREPEDPELLYGLGWFYVWTLPSRAERYMRRALRREPGHAEALSVLGLLLGRRGAWEEADAALDLAVASGAAGALPYVYRGHNAVERRRYAEALEAYGQAIRVAPGDAHPWHAIGDIHRGAGRVDEARAAYEEALRVDPRSSDALLRLGRLEDGVGHGVEARRLIAEGLRIAPHHPWAGFLSRRLAELEGRA